MYYSVSTWSKFLSRPAACRRLWPEKQYLCADIIREYFFISPFKVCAESLASENSRRLAAMERVDQNINELLENLHGTFHRLRQTSIEEELFDVISGFEALTASDRDH